MSVILVTGSSTGIGQETALHMSRNDHTVYAAVRNPDTAQELREKIAAKNKISDQEWIELNCLQGEEFYDRWEEFVGGRLLSR